ncbi:hypothetical protein [Dactylosporangium sp. CA-233914]|uniref:hypothetical protein n=1 Tax=Dactylosporangium sp. CA-233914 TaxID=3239934 RepID=UPI003D925D06
MRSVTAVAEAMLRSWRREMIRALGDSVGAYRAVVVTLLLAAAGWVYLAVSTRKAVGADELHRAGLHELLLALTLNLTLATAALGAVGLILLIPNESAFGTLLATAPMRAVQRRLALDLPAMLLTLGLAGSMSAPFLWLSIQGAPGPAEVTAVVASWLAVALGGMLVAASVFRLLVSLTVRLVGIHRPLAQAVGALAMFGLVGYQCVANQASTDDPTAARWLLRALTHASLAAPAGALAIAFSVVLLAALVWWATSSLVDRHPAGDRSRLIGLRTARVGRRPRSLTLLELLQATRHPGNVALIFVLIGAAIAVAVVEPVRDVLFWPAGGLLIFAMLGLVPLSSYGATWTHHWIYRAATASRGRWVGPKWAATAILWLVVFGAISAALLATPGWDPGLVLGATPPMVATFATTMLVGLVIPVGEEQPLSSVAAVVLATTVGLAVSMAFNELAASNVLPIVVVVLVMGGGILLYRRLARWRERDLVF